MSSCILVAIWCLQCNMVKMMIRLTGFEFYYSSGATISHTVLQIQRQCPADFQVQGYVAWATSHTGPYVKGCMLVRVVT